MPPWRARATAQRRTFLETKWRQRPPHTGQLRERTLLPLHACPTSNPKALLQAARRAVIPSRGSSSLAWRPLRRLTSDFQPAQIEQRPHGDRRGRRVLHALSAEENRKVDRLATA